MEYPAGPLPNLLWQLCLSHPQRPHHEDCRGGGGKCACVWVGEQGAKTENWAVLSYLNCSSLLKTAIALFSLSFQAILLLSYQRQSRGRGHFLRSPLSFCQNHWGLGASFTTPSKHPTTSLPSHRSLLSRWPPFSPESKEAGQPAANARFLPGCILDSLELLINSEAQVPSQGQKIRISGGGTLVMVFGSSSGDSQRAAKC